jgi:hypothetical protein
VRLKAISDYTDLFTSIIPMFQSGSRLYVGTQIVLLLLFLCPGFSRADIIYLKSGDIIQGRITKKTSESVVVVINKGEKTFLPEEIDKIEYSDQKNIEQRYKSETHRKAMKSIERRVEEESLELKGGPQIGVYSFRDSILSKHHGTSYVWGGNLNLWFDKIYCVGFEAESYRHKYKGSLSLYDTNGNYLGVYNASEDISLVPIWLSFMTRYKKSALYFGGSIGVVVSNMTITVNTQDYIYRGNFLGFQLVSGILSKKAGLMFKYSVVNNDQFWNNSSGIGGVSFLLNIFL